MTRHALLILVLVMMAGVAYGQKETGKSPANSKPPAPKRKVTRTRPAARATVSQAALEEAAIDIAAQCPEVSDETLNDDAEVVEDSIGAIRQVFSKRGYGVEDARQAALAAWKLMRTKLLSSTSMLSMDELVKYATGLGKLVITSAPSGARIEIDGELLKDSRGRPLTTDALRWPPAGRHRIKLILDGYETVDEDCDVEDENEARFHRVLKPKKP